MATEVLLELTSDRSLVLLLASRTTERCSTHRSSLSPKNIKCDTVVAMHVELIEENGRTFQLSVGTDGKSPEVVVSVSERTLTKGTQLFKEPFFNKAVGPAETNEQVTDEARAEIHRVAYL